MYKTDGVISQRKKKTSELNQIKDEIEEILSNNFILIKGAWFYFKREAKLSTTYSNIKKYVRKNNLNQFKNPAIPHLFNETDPGEQLQVDWVENLSFITRHEKNRFNLFSATLGYSRFHSFKFSKGKTEQDFKRCLVIFFTKIGGLTQNVLTDNMSAIVSIAGNNRQKHQSILQFEKDLGIKIKLCKVRTPETKGKDETSNKFA